MLLFLAFLELSFQTSLIQKPQSEVQWEDNYWYDCVTKQQIIPQKCQNLETNWEECSMIPNNGACLKNGILKQFSGQGNFMLYTNLTDSQSSNLRVYVDGEEQTLVKVKQENYDTYSFSHQNSFTLLKITGQGYIQRLDASQDCLTNCKQCQNNLCQQCDDMLFNSRCIDMACFNILSQLTPNTLTSNNALIIQQSGTYQLNLTFNVPLGGCLVPKVYLIKSLQSSEITYILQESYINLLNLNTLQINLDTVAQDYCEIIDSAKYIVKQCYINVALSFIDVSQYILTMIAQIKIQKQSTTILQFTNPINLQSSDQQNIYVITDIDNLKIDLDNYQITTTQIIQDQQQSNNYLQFDSGNITINQNVYQLQLVKTISQSIGRSTYLLTPITKGLNLAQNFTITLQSKLVNAQRRQLIMERGQLKLNYIGQSSKEYKINQKIKVDNKPDRSQDQIAFYAVIISLIVFLIIFIIKNIKCKKTKEVAQVQSQNIEENSEKQYAQN